MRRTKKRKAGLGDNLYGIPLDDILTPEQIEDMKYNPAPMATHRRRRRTQKRKKSGFRISDIRLSRNMSYAVCAVVVLIVLLNLFRTPLAVHLMPRSYVADAFGNTVVGVNKELSRTAKAVFGFDIAEKGELTFSAHGGIKDSSYGNLAGLYVESVVGYSKKSSELNGSMTLIHRDEEFLRSAFYINNEEAGISIPQLFGEYWVADAATFGSDWNKSGFRRALYKNEIPEDTDISFSALFGEKGFLSKEGLNTLKKSTTVFISSAKADYSGKCNITIGDKIRKGRGFTYDIPGDVAEKYLQSVLTLVMDDDVAFSNMPYALARERVLGTVSDIASRLEDGISVDGMTIDFVEYKGKIMYMGANILYRENGIANKCNIQIASHADDNITDDMQFAIAVTGDKNYKLDINSVGNHSAKDKVFTDITSYNIVTNSSEISGESNVVCDIKNGTVEGTFTESTPLGVDEIVYSGTCGKKGGLTLDLTDVNITSTSDGGYLKGDINISVKSGSKSAKTISAAKKRILDIDKAEMEKYLQKLEKTDGVKGFLEKKEYIKGPRKDAEDENAYSY